MADTNHTSRRDRNATEDRLVQALARVLARQGFAKVGVNAVAREAGVDKVLIYRYFGGLDGLVRRLADDPGFWPGEEELLDGIPDDTSSLPRADVFAMLARNWIAALGARPLTQEVMTWQLTESGGLTRELDERIETAMTGMLDRLGATGHDRRPDIQAMAALIGGGLVYLLLRSRTTRLYSGVDLHSVQGWERLHRAVRDMIRGGLAIHDDTRENTQ
jgi:AcrR family transcriptional regulator